MRVEAYSKVQQLYQSHKTVKEQKINSTSQSDQLQISSFGKEIQIAKAALAGSPDVREELTAPIKEKIANGTYSVDTSTFAEKLLQKYEEMR